MNALELKTYEGLKEKLGESLAKDVLTLMDESSKAAVVAQKESFVTKQEFKIFEADIRKEDSRLEVLIKSEVAGLKTDINRLDQRMDTRFAEFESRFVSFETRIIRQIYWMNLVQLLAIIGAVLAIFRLTK